MRVEFAEVARLAHPNDNVAIATQRLNTGTAIAFQNHELIISHTILVGHRFAVRDIASERELLSWGQVFGMTTRPIQAGEYIVNDDVLNELRNRSLEIDLPGVANFRNQLSPYQFDAAQFTPAPALPRYSDIRSFLGYKRPGERGVGTRNTVVLLGVSSLVSGFVRKLEEQLQPHLAEYENINGIVAVAHTEGASGKPNNVALLLRTLAGFIVHPNVAAVLIVDYGNEAVNSAGLRDYMHGEGYALSSVTYHFMSLTHSFEDDLSRARNVVMNWLEPVNNLQRSAQPLSQLKIALQCGGSDAFSGISGNPLAAWVGKEIIRYGGCANLAETDELIGAESYVLDKVRDLATAQKFLDFVVRFKERVSWHGHSAEGNPSGGNKLRGLYNIYLKSLGAATKRHPDVRLDYVIDYSERMLESGYYFMDSPGNDLESIAGQVAAGCNMIFFITGNGSITNFPFVPTIKIVTTSERYQLLANDMDVNAGAYLDGVAMDDLGHDTLQYTIHIASGQLSVGEQAGHSQVQIWRDWQLSQSLQVQAQPDSPFSGNPLVINTEITVPEISVKLYRTDDTITSDQVGLILPTSLCSGQIANLCVQVLNQHPILAESGMSRFVTLPHTEGCGSSANNEFRQTLLGYLAHPFVKHALFLEHGCEMTHNDYFRHALTDTGYDPKQYGWASIQLGGGIQSVVTSMIKWFADQIASESMATPIVVGLENVQVAIATQESLTDDLAYAYARITQMIVAAGGTVIIHEHDRLLRSEFVSQIGVKTDVHITLDYAQLPAVAGLHIMSMPTHNWSEIITGLGASGVQLILTHCHKIPLHGHPMIPVISTSTVPSLDADLLLTRDSDLSLLKLIADTLSQAYVPKLTRSGNVHFQITRGLLGVSL